MGIVKWRQIAQGSAGLEESSCGGARPSWTGRTTEEEYSSETSVRA